MSRRSPNSPDVRLRRGGAPRRGGFGRGTWELHVAPPGGNAGRRRQKSVRGRRAAAVSGRFASSLRGCGARGAGGPTEPFRAGTHGAAGDTSGTFRSSLDEHAVPGTRAARGSSPPVPSSRCLPLPSTAERDPFTALGDGASFRDRFTCRYVLEGRPASVTHGPCHETPDQQWPSSAGSTWVEPTRVTARRRAAGASGPRAPARPRGTRCPPTGA